MVSGDNQLGEAGSPLALPISVRVNDKSGDPVSGVTVNFAVVAGGGSVPVATTTTNAQGLAATTWTMGTTAGTPSTAAASATGLSGSPISFSATVQAAPASTATLLQGDAQNGEVGQPLSTSVVAEFHDAFGNLAASQAVAWVVTGGGGSVSATSGLTDAQGRATAGWTLGYELGGGQALRAQVATASATASATAALGAGSTLAAGAGNNQTGLAGTSLAASINVRVRTATGQNVAKVPIAWAVTPGGGFVVFLQHAQVGEDAKNDVRVFDEGYYFHRAAAMGTSPFLPRRSVPIGVHFVNFPDEPRPVGAGVGRGAFLGRGDSHDGA